MQVESKMSMVAELLKERRDALYNITLQLKVKAGQVGRGRRRGEDG